MTGLESCARRSWANAYESLTRADQADPLGPEDLELLAASAWMTGRDDDVVSALERATLLPAYVEIMLTPGDVEQARRGSRELGDEDTAALELDAARHAFGQLGAAPDVARIDSMTANRSRERPR